MGREKLDVVVLLDNSGSMLRDAGRPGNDVHFTRLAAVQYLVEKMAPGDRVALVTFDSVVHTDPGASQLRDVASPGMPESFYASVRQIAASPSASTNMADGLRSAAALLRGSKDPRRRRFLILLTDGTPNPERGENTPARLVSYAGDLARRGITLHTVGLGDLSTVPTEADDARRLLMRMAVRGGGVSHLARTADDLPALFGSVFAQLVGHEVSRPLASGAQARFTISPGTHNLRVIATSDGAPPQLELADPAGRAYAAAPIPPLLPGRQTALLAAASINNPPPGTWTVRAIRGALEVAWEPDFGAILRDPPPGAPVPSHASVHLIVDVRQKGSAAPLMLLQGRAEAEYRSDPKALPITVPLIASPDGRFEGDLPDSGPAGPHELVVRCFRHSEAGEEEGGPARAGLDVEDIPALTVVAPAAGTLDTLGVPVPVEARVLLAGAPLSPQDSAGLGVAATLGNGVNASRSSLRPSPDGAFTGNAIPAGPVGPAMLSCTLSGSYRGETLTPQTVSMPLTLTSRPIVEIIWPARSPITPGPDSTVNLEPSVRSTSGAATPMELSVEGLPRASLAPATFVVPGGPVVRSVPLRLLCRGVPPGRYAITLMARTDAPSVDVIGSQWRTVVYVPTWLERNRWWLYPAVGLTALLVLLVTAGIMVWLQEQARRRRKMLDLLNGAAVYVPHTARAFKPPLQTALMCRSYTFGGEGADVPIPDPQRPGQTLFSEPRLRIGVAWQSGRGCLIRAGRACLLVTLEGAQTQWYDTDGKLLAPPLSPTEGGVMFRVEPEHVLVRVNSEWTS